MHTDGKTELFKHVLEAWNDTRRPTLISLWSVTFTKNIFL
jgi:hypothetical protein